MRRGVWVVVGVAGSLAAGYIGLLGLAGVYGIGIATLQEVDGDHVSKPCRHVSDTFSQ